MTDKSQAVIGSDKFGSEFVIGDTKLSLGDLVAAAHSDSRLSVEDWNQLPQDERDLYLQVKLEALQSAAIPKGDGPLKESAAAEAKAKAEAEAAAQAAAEQREKQRGEARRIADESARQKAEDEKIVASRAAAKKKELDTERARIDREIAETPEREYIAAGNDMVDPVTKIRFTSSEAKSSKMTRWLRVQVAAGYIKPQG